MCFAMKNFGRTGRFWVGVSLVALLFLGGCGESKRKRLAGPLVRRTLPEVMGILQGRVDKAEAVRGSGQCVLEYYPDGKKKKESFPVKVWLNPMSEVYMQGDVFFDPRGLVLGSNSEEFWLWLRPKEISSYWWGRWSDSGSDRQLLISPKVVLEAMGIVAVGDSDGVWEIGWDDGYEILTQRGEGNVAKKRIYCEGVQCEVRKIEYYGMFGGLSVVAELDDYGDVGDGFSVPRTIRVVKREREGRNTTVVITLKSLRTTEFSQEQIEYIFRRKEPDAFRHVFESVGGRWVEQVK